ncbi:MAG TPA: isocitrate lyase/phosphoenolpyruvate mutase family protein [Gemmatimonadaceae bacterium]|nr:isocitrate lyase/phosphoenolpyruvate mutase family protein [Gemmatimonadaceae bacterium]
MTNDLQSRRRAFRDLHREGFFVLPNPWDVGGARRLEKLGFRALASTSAGLAWSLGHDDLTLSRDVVLDHLRALCASTSLPVNADFEAGFAERPDDVAANVRLAVETGVAGLSIEDRDGGRLFDLALAAERIRASRAAIDEVDPNVVLVGRTEGFLIGHPDIDATIERLVAYSDAGADCLYAPGVSEPAHIEAIVAAVAPKPVNVLLVSPAMRIADLQAMGVRRASTGGFLARAAWAAFEGAARTLLEQGELPAQVYR